MALPKTLVYNDLTGDEIKHILAERFIALLNDVPYLQRHITLPRVRMTLDVHLDCWAEQKDPERQSLSDSVEVLTEGAQIDGDLVLSVHKRSVVDASPKGQPPDKIREEHGLGVPTPTRGPISIEDHIDQPSVESRRVVMPNGAIVDRTGNSGKARAASTVVEQDFGPARERFNKDTSPKLANQHRGGSVAPVNWSNEDK